TDRATQAVARLAQPFEVLPKTFGIVRVSMSMDADAAFPVPPIGVPGQSLWVKFYTVGFQRDRANRPQPNVQVVMRILDQNGKPTLADPNAGEVNDDVPEGVAAIPWQFKIE